ncbi:MAG TPA: LuxR C-terminal-related transcriptional regulator [Paucimonas sp.]|nr:LuxR C-terminal-related transcriptional regulator [Paucimonas sp.]
MNTVQKPISIDPPGTNEPPGNYERLTFIDSKLAPPHISFDMLPILRLEERFGAALGRRLVCISAPAGYGKTTTLTKLHDFAQIHGIKTGWIAIGSEDNDPVRFLYLVFEALSRAIPGLTLPTYSCETNRSAPSIETILASLCDTVTATENRIGLFLDDYHLIDNDVVHRAMDWLINRGPQNLSFIVATRKQLPIRLSKLRLAQDIHEINAGDLSLKREEAEVFLNCAGGQRLTVGQIKLLHERTEGWIAGLQLASLALRRVRNVDEFINAFSGNDRDITAYLGELVLSQLPDSLCRFLKRTALFDYFSVEFCREILAEDEAASLIESIRESGLFLVSLDRQGQWFRYHHLFGDYLKSQFILFAPNEAKVLYNAASTWFELRECANDAIRYALAAQEYGRAADLIGKCAENLVRLRGEYTTLLNWIEALPRHCVEERPVIQVAYAWALMLTHQYQKAESEIASLEKLTRILDRPDMSEEGRTLLSRLKSKVTVLRCIYYGVTAQPALAEAQTREWLEKQAPDSDPIDLSAMLHVAGYIAFLSHEFKQAARNFLAARKILEQAGSYQGIAFPIALHGYAILEQGDAMEAERIVLEARARISEKIGTHTAGAFSLDALHARVCYEQNRIDEAERILDNAFTFSNTLIFGEGSLFAHATKARILWLRGLLDESDNHLAQAASAAKQIRADRAAFMLNAERIHLLLKSERIEQALSIAHSIGLLDTSRDPSRSRNPPERCTGVRLVDIRLQLATGHAERAQLPLNDLIVKARRYGIKRWLVKFLCIKAGILAADNSRDEALRILDEALVLGAAGGLYRTVIDEGNVVEELLQKIADRRRSGKERSGAAPLSEYLIQLLYAFGREQVPTSSAPVVSPLALPRQDMLSEREIQILKLVDMGLKNRDLAKQLFVSDETIKWHLRNIYAKLSVNSRTSAVARARELSLL